MKAGLRLLVVPLMLLCSLASAATHRVASKVGMGGTDERLAKSFVKKELSFIGIVLSKKITKACKVDVFKLLGRISELQRRSDNYYNSRNINDFILWIGGTYGCVGARDLKERIHKMLNESGDLVDEISKHYPDTGVFHRGNTRGFPQEHDNYLARAMKDSQQLKRLGESCLERIAFKYFMRRMETGTYSKEERTK